MQNIKEHMFEIMCGVIVLAIAILSNFVHTDAADVNNTPTSVRYVVGK